MVGKSDSILPVNAEQGEQKSKSTADLERYILTTFRVVN